MNKIIKRIAKSNKETRTYKITSNIEMLDKVEMLFHTMYMLGSLGGSDIIKL